MTFLAQLRGGDMRQWIGIDVATAAGAVVGYASVIKCSRRFPRQRTVAIFAIVATRNMAGDFSSGGYAIVTAAATAEDFMMIKKRYRLPRCYLVTFIAHIGADDMSHALAGCAKTVVARAASAKYLGMIDLRDRFPGHKVMATIA